MSELVEDHIRMTLGVGAAILTVITFLVTMGAMLILR